MTHIVNDKCVKCKHTDCVEVCPVDCFYEGEFMLVINPEECIDCGVCIPECPEDAIEEESPELVEWVKINSKYAKIWPRITEVKPSPPDAELYRHETNKFKKYVEPDGS